MTDRFVIEENDDVSVVIDNPTDVNVSVSDSAPPPTSVAIIGGVPGAAGTVSIGSVSTGTPGSSAIVTNTGTPSAAIFNFTIPSGAAGAQGERGLKGDPGDDATVSFFSGIMTTASQDGVNVTFPLPQSALHPANIMVSRNGLLEVYGLGFSATQTHITFTTPPLDTDVISVSYQI